ncbi:MAG TPA: 50S ribosomal protein L4 [Verrucomicrobiae bacterium]|jgi:large subunit ribosomal protein L4|nr:50S ribosomal protein L4 [Verrucomicrobiae bacterium]
MKLTVKNINGKDSGELQVKFPLVEGGKGTQAVHDVVVAHQANQRMGTASTKTMGEVAGSGKKPWRQKGTGRARAGSFASPLWVGGGVVFGPKPRDFGKKVSRKTKQLALRKALTERLNAGDVVVVDDFKLGSPKTKGFIDVLKKLEVTGTALVVAPAIEQNLRLATRNLEKVEVTTADDLNTYQVLRSDKLLFSRPAFEKLEERLTD